MRSPAWLLRLLLPLASLVVPASGCEAPPAAVYRKGLERGRLTRVNFRSDGTVLRTANFLAHPSVVPAGSAARIMLYSPKEIRLELSGLEFTMRPLGAESFPTDDAGMDRFLRKYFVDPGQDATLEGLGPGELEEAVRAGNPAIGMTKEQVYVCLGPPYQVDEGRSAFGLAREEILQSDHWVYPQTWLLVVPQVVDLYFGLGRLQKLAP